MGTEEGTAGVGDCVGRGVGATVTLGSEEGDMDMDGNRVTGLGIWDGHELNPTSVGVPLDTEVGRVLSTAMVGSKVLIREVGEKVGLDDEGDPDGATVFPTFDGENDGLLVAFSVVGASVRG